MNVIEVGELARDRCRRWPARLLNPDTPANQ